MKKWILFALVFVGTVIGLVRYNKKPVPDDAILIKIDEIQKMLDNINEK